MSEELQREFFEKLPDDTTAASVAHDDHETRWPSPIDCRSSR